MDWPLFFFGLLVFILGSIGLMLGYAAAAMEEAEHERGSLARLTLRICALLGMEEPLHDTKPQEDRESHSGVKR